MSAIELVEKSQLADRPAMKSGDTVKVHVKVREGDKERIQVFEGVVIGMHRGGTRASFTVRKVSFGQGVERIFPYNSKVVDKVEKIRSYEVRRAKLFYLRGLRGKAARLREVERANAKLENKLQRAPTDEEIAGELGITVDELNESLLAISHSSMVALDELWSVSDSSGDQVSLMDTIEDPGAPDPARALDVGDLKDRIAESIAMLPERALEELRQGAGTQFDASVIDAFERVVATQRAVRT